jgi:hypothetical protein
MKALKTNTKPGHTYDLARALNAVFRARRTAQEGPGATVTLKFGGRHP